MSFKKISKRLNRVCSRILNFLTYNKIVRNIDFLLSIFIVFIWITSTFIEYPLYLIVISNLVGSLLVIYFIITLSWEMYNDKAEIEELKGEIERLKLNDWLYTSDLETDLATLTHDFWSQDMQHEINNAVEFKRSNADIEFKTKCWFTELTNEEQQINRKKAVRILRVIKDHV